VNTIGFADPEATVRDLQLALDGRSGDWAGWIVRFRAESLRDSRIITARRYRPNCRSDDGVSALNLAPHLGHTRHVASSCAVGA